MNDPRLDKLARVLVEYCIELKPGMELRIDGPYMAEPLILALWQAALRAGAHPSTQIALQGLSHLNYRHASDDQLRHVSEIERQAIEQLDAIITVWGDWNKRELTGVAPAKVALVRAARKELFQRMLQRIGEGSLRWCGTQYPTQADAQDAEMALGDYEDFVFGAMLLDAADPIAEWRKVSQEQDRLVRFLDRVREIEVLGPDTELRFRCAGRKWVNCDGKENFPDGEIFTSPIEDSVEGTIRFSFPAVHLGREVTDVRLRFSQGRVVEARAAKGEDFLVAMLDTDAGARRVGEIAFGTNYGIQRFTRNTLFDEKIGGTLHLALGASLPEAGGKNESALHWDIVTDLRQAGEVRADGEPIFRNGRFVI